MSSASFHGDPATCETPARPSAGCRTSADRVASHRRASPPATAFPAPARPSNVPCCLPASRKHHLRHGPALGSAFTPGPARLMANCCRPSVLPFKLSVITRPASVFDSVQWLNAAPLMDSTSKPAGIAKLNRKIPARVMSPSRWPRAPCGLRPAKACPAFRRARPARPLRHQSGPSRPRPNSETRAALESGDLCSRQLRAAAGIILQVDGEDSLRRDRDRVELRCPSPRPARQSGSRPCPP